MKADEYKDAWNLLVNQLMIDVRLERRRRGLTLRQAALEIGTTFTDLSKWETARVVPRWDSMYGLIEWLSESEVRPSNEESIA